MPKKHSTTRRSLRFSPVPSEGTNSESGCSTSTKKITDEPSRPPKRMAGLTARAIMAPEAKKPHEPETDQPTEPATTEQVQAVAPPENEEQSSEIPNDAVVVTINGNSEANAKSGKQSGVNGVINISPMSLYAEGRKEIENAKANGDWDGIWRKIPVAACAFEAFFEGSLGEMIVINHIKRPQ